MLEDRQHYGPSPSRRKKLDDLWMHQNEDARVEAAGVIASTFNGIIASDGTIAGAVLPLSDATPAAETFGTAGTPGTADIGQREGHVHPMPPSPIPAHVATVDAHPEYVLESMYLVKGDLLVGTGTGTLARLPAPLVPGFSLVSDPSTTTGLRWAATPTGATSGVLDGTDNVVDGTDEVVVS